MSRLSIRLAYWSVEAAFWIRLIVGRILPLLVVGVIVLVVGVIVVLSW